MEKINEIVYGILTPFRWLVVNLDMNVLLGMSLVVGFLLLVIILNNVKESDGIIEAFSGSSDIKLFQDKKERGAEKTAKRIVNILIFLFVVLMFMMASKGQV
jgi:protein translocase SecG subunit